MSELPWKGEDIDTVYRDVLTEIIRQQHFRIEALEGCLREIKDQYLTPDQSSAIAKAALAEEADKP